MIGASLGGIGALLVSYDEAASDVSDRLDQGGVLWMQWVGYTHDEMTCKIYSLGQDWQDFPAKEKQLASLLKFHSL